MISLAGEIFPVSVGVFVAFLGHVDWRIFCLVDWAVNLTFLNLPFSLLDGQFLIESNREFFAILIGWRFWRHLIGWAFSAAIVIWFALSRDLFSVWKLDFSIWLCFSLMTERVDYCAESAYSVALERPFESRVPSAESAILAPAEFQQRARLVLRALVNRGKDFVSFYS